MRKEIGIQTRSILNRLERLAMNLWWSWNPRAQEIFREFSPLIWETTNHNPVAVIKQISNDELLPGSEIKTSVKD